jgi:hypothetical protein
VICPVLYIALSLSIFASRETDIKRPSKGIAASAARPKLATPGAASALFLRTTPRALSILSNPRSCASLGSPDPRPCLERRFWPRRRSSWLRRAERRRRPRRGQRRSWRPRRPCSNRPWGLSRCPAWGGTLLRLSYSSKRGTTLPPSWLYRPVPHAL